MHGVPQCLALGLPAIEACPQSGAPAKGVQPRRIWRAVHWQAAPAALLCACSMWPHAPHPSPASCAAAVWDVQEQVAVAAMEAGCRELALRLVSNCHKRFPEGARGSRLAVRCGGRPNGARGRGGSCCSPFLPWACAACCLLRLTAHLVLLHLARLLILQGMYCELACCNKPHRFTPPHLPQHVCRACTGQAGQCCLLPRTEHIFCPRTLLACRACTLRRWASRRRPLAAASSSLQHRASKPTVALQGMYFEALGKPEEAEALYQKELERDPHSPLILKRMVGGWGCWWWRLMLLVCAGGRRGPCCLLIPKRMVGGGRCCRGAPLLPAGCACPDPTPPHPAAAGPACRWACAGARATWRGRPRRCKSTWRCRWVPVQCGAGLLQAVGAGRCRHTPDRAHPVGWVPSPLLAAHLPARCCRPLRHPCVAAPSATRALQGTDWLAWEEAADLYLSLQVRLLALGVARGRGVRRRPTAALLPRPPALTSPSPLPRGNAQMYQQAAFCLEELLLHQPGDAGRHLALADCLYTQGGAERWRAALAYYSGACMDVVGLFGAAAGVGGWRQDAGWACWAAGAWLAHMPCSPPHARRPLAARCAAGVIEMTQGRNLRALYGACACAAQLAGARRGGGGSGGSSGDGEQVGRLAAEALLQQYAVSCPGKLPVVRGMLKDQGLL